MNVRRVVTGKVGRKVQRSYRRAARAAAARSKIFPDNRRRCCGPRRQRPARQPMARTWFPKATSYVPQQPGETRLMIVTFAPDSVMMSIDPVAGFQEFAEHIPDLAAAMEPDSPGMHTTQTVDYGIVLEGEVWLELDDGKQVHLKPHDVVVQNGTRHAWRTKATSR